MTRINTANATSANALLNDKIGSFFGSEVLQSKAGINKAKILAEKKRKKTADLVNSALVVANIALPGISAVKEAKALAKIGATKATEVVGKEAVKQTVTNQALKPGLASSLSGKSVGKLTTTATKAVTPKINVFKEFGRGVLRQNKSGDLYNITTESGEIINNVPRYVLNAGKNLTNEKDRIELYKGLMGSI